MKHNKENVIKLLEVIKDHKERVWDTEKSGYMKGVAFGEYSTVQMILNIIKNKESFEAYADIYELEDDEK